MIRAASDTAPRSTWRIPPALPPPGAVFALLLAGTPLLLVSGCQVAPQAPGSAAAPATSPSRVGASADARTPRANPRSTPRSRPAGWQTVLAKWFQAASRPRAGAAPTARAATRPEVTIDVAAIARRHPAWRLADALERGGPVPVALSTLQLSRQRLAAPMPFGPLRVAPPGGAAGFSRDELRVEVKELGRLEVEARVKQERAINAFIADVTTRQTAARSAEAQALRAGLEEDVAAAKRLNLPELQPALPSDPVQLEMTNLRLDLLRNVYTTPQARAQALQRLHELEAQWEATLRSQEAQRLQELQEARVQRPLQIREQGEAHIKATLDAAAQRDAAARQSVLSAQQARIVQDLKPDQPGLAITLPAASLPGQQLPGQGAAGAQASGQQHPAAARHPGVLPVSGPQNIHKTSPPAATSAAYKSLPDQSGRRAEEIRALRAQAWSDARRWTRIAASRAGWHWNEGAGNRGGAVSNVLPDRTQDVLRILNLS